MFGHSRPNLSSTCTQNQDMRQRHCLNVKSYHRGRLHDGTGKPNQKERICSPRCSISLTFNRHSRTVCASMESAPGKQDVLPGAGIGENRRCLGDRVTVLHLVERTSPGLRLSQESARSLPLAEQSHTSPPSRPRELVARSANAGPTG